MSLTCGEGTNAHKPIRRWHNGQNSNVASGLTFVRVDNDALATLRVLVSRCNGGTRGLPRLGVPLRDADEYARLDRGRVGVDGVDTTADKGREMDVYLVD